MLRMTSRVLLSGVFAIAALALPMSANATPMASGPIVSQYCDPPRGYCCYDPVEGTICEI